MSRIPGKAMPHAYSKPEEEQRSHGGLIGLARENPKTAIAAGAALVAGAVAAAAIPLVRGARAGKKR
jgi:hypothetical protein